MKLIILVLIVVSALCFVNANGRHVDNEYDELPDSEGQSELINRMRDHSSQMRHRRRSRQMYGYDYPPPYFFLDHRRESNSNNRQDEILSHIVKTLDEILIYMKRPPTPPPAPQPVYIPYPVYQSRPCNCRGTTYRLCKLPSGNKTQTDDSDDELGNRFNIKGMEDQNQNWGLIPVETNDYDDGGDGSRPINFIPVKPGVPISRPPPPVNHGTSQAGAEQTTQAPVSPPGMCETAILNCCIMPDTTSKRNCFARYNCSRTFATNRACDPQVIDQVLEHFKKAYAPVNNSL